MNITIDGIKKLDAAKQLVFITIVDGLDSFMFQCNTPIVPLSALPVYLDSNIEVYRKSIYRTQYRDADISQATGNTEFEKFEDWIANGAKNPDATDADGNVTVGATITKAAWVGNHDALYTRQFDGGKVKQTSVGAIRAKAELAGPEVLAFCDELLKLLVADPFNINPNA